MEKWQKLEGVYMNVAFLSTKFLKARLALVTLTILCMLSLQMMKQFHEREAAATKIQTIFRGRRVRRLQKDTKKQAAAIKMQGMFQKWKVRRAIEKLVDGRALRELQNRDATTVQCAYRYARHKEKCLCIPNEFASFYRANVSMHI